MSSRAAEIRASSWGSVYLLAVRHGDSRMAFDAMQALRQEWPDVDPRAIVRALQTGRKQGARRGRPRRYKPRELLAT